MSLDYNVLKRRLMREFIGMADEDQLHYLRRWHMRRIEENQQMLRFINEQLRDCRRKKIADPGNHRKWLDTLKQISEDVKDGE